MDKRFISIIVVIVVVAGLLLFQASRSGTSQVLLPSELLAEAQLVGKEPLTRLRVAGRVADRAIEYHDTAPFKLSFEIEDPTGPNGAVPVVYNDLKPDMFAPGRDVIIEGEYRDGALRASRLLTQCPSKYKPPTGYNAPENSSTAGAVQ